MEVTYDDKLARRVDRQWYRSHRRERIKSLFKSIWNTMLFSLLPAYMAHFYAVKEGAIGGIIAFLVITVAQATLYALLGPMQAADIRSKENRDKKWTYEMTDDYWGWTVEEGVSVRASWSSLKLDSEMQDAYSIHAGDTEVLVLKTPLQQAGIEAEFRRRLGLSGA